jgi:hypothetical protein
VDHLGRLARVVSGIVPMRRRGDRPERPEDGSGDHPEHRAGVVPAIMAVDHPEDRAEDHGSQGDQGRQDGQSWDEVLGRRALAVPASWR